MVKDYYKATDLNPSGNIGYLVRRSAGLMADLIEAVFDAHGVSFTQWIILKSLRLNGEQCLGDVSRFVGYDPATVSRAVDQLHGAGLVARGRSAADRRAIVLTLTPAGDDFITRYAPLCKNELNTLLDDFTREEADTLVALLQRVLEKLTCAQEQRKSQADK